MMIEQDTPYDDGDASKYWELVKRTLRYVFQENPDLAEDLRRDIASNSDSSKEEQLLIYHAEPLDVAADLAGEPQPSESQINRYLFEADKMGWRLPPRP